MSIDRPTPPRRRGPAYPTAVLLVLAVLAVGALLGGIVVPQYLKIHPVFSAQPQQLATQAPAAAPALPAAPSGPRVVVPEEQAVINVVKRVQPAVVNINTEGQVQTFFGVVPQQGAGSGVIVRSDGYILTNNHVVQDATAIKVRLLGGKVLSGKVVGKDPFADLAVIKVDAPSPLPAVQLGSSDLQIGQLAIAIGNPFGLGSTVTTGVVSALHRNIQAPNLIVEDLIQTSAAINPGNSGGALVDSSGRVIGINTAIIQNAQGIGFAIPGDVARAEMEQLIAQGRVVRPFVGVDYGGDVDAQIGRQYNLGTDHGVLVRQVAPGSPAARAGVQSGDIITAVDGNRIDNWNDFLHSVLTRHIGDTITLAIMRSHAALKVPIKLAPRPAEAQ